MRTRGVRSQRWAISFADLCLLLLGVFIILQARPDPHQLTRGIRSTFAPAQPMAEASAESLFEPGEAILSVKGRSFVTAFNARTRKGQILVGSTGTDKGSSRFDGWELAAARAAALARALAADGVPESRISLQMDRTNGGAQTLSLEAR